MTRVPLEEQIKIIAQVKDEIDRTMNGTLIYLTISGSDLYGFPSKDSDVDYRGAYLTGTEGLLGLNQKRDVIEMKPDIVLFEMLKELHLALKGNCNVLEHINAEPVYRTAEFLEMRQMVNNAFPKQGVYNSYRGMVMFNYKKFIMRGRKTYKKYLYVLRGMMAGIYVLQTGRIESNIETLNKYFKLPEVKTLIKAKREGFENDTVTGIIEDGSLDAMIPPLFERMDKAYVKSKIPDRVDPDLWNQVNSWLINLRKEKIGK
jgi:predicted nucleotidyltransferase